MLAYSGGLDTSVMIKWLQEKYNAEVITATVNVGQPEDLVEVEEKAKENGCYLAHLKTFNIEAKKFFIKNGYEVFGVLDNYPENHKTYYMKKMF